MRIAIVSTPFVRVPPTGYGGTELFCGHLAEALVRRGHDVTLFATGDSRFSGELRAIFDQPCWPPTESVERAHARFSLNEIANARVPYDAVQLNSPAAIPLAREHDLSVVYTIHHKREERLSRLYAEHSEVHYVAISRRQLELEAPLVRASVIHHGIEADAYSPSLHDDGYVLHLGRFAEEKGTHLAIDAAIQAHVPIVLAGRVHPNDEDRNYFKRELRPRLDCREVIEVGEADFPRKVGLLRGARALLCPVQWEEPFGLIAIEAMISGTPVIAFPRGSFPEIIDKGVTGVIVSDVQEMACTIEPMRRWDRKKCMTLARQRFSAERMAREYERVFEARLRRSGPYRTGTKGALASNESEGKALSPWAPAERRTSS